MPRDNMECNNIRVVSNHPLGLRLLRNTHAVTFTAVRNHVEKGYRVEADGELPGTPGACKRVVRRPSADPRRVPRCPAQGTGRPRMRYAA